METTIAHETFRPADFADPDAYQREALVTWTRDPIPSHPCLYPALGIVDEAGEVAGKVKKMHRDGGGKFTTELRTALCKELGDVLWYTAVLAHEHGIRLASIIAAPSSRILGRATLPLAVARMCNVAGAVAGLVVASFEHGGHGSTLGPYRARLATELEYLVRAIVETAAAAGITLEEVMAANINKLRGRQARGTIHGNGDDR